MASSAVYMVHQGVRTPLLQIPPCHILFSPKSWFSLYHKHVTKSPEEAQKFRTNHGTLHRHQCKEPKYAILQYMPRSVTDSVAQAYMQGTDGLTRYELQSVSGVLQSIINQPISTWESAAEKANEALAEHGLKSKTPDAPFVYRYYKWSKEEGHREVPMSEAWSLNGQETDVEDPEPSATHLDAQQPFVKTLEDTTTAFSDLGLEESGTAAASPKVHEQDNGATTTASPSVVSVQNDAAPASSVASVLDGEPRASPAPSLAFEEANGAEPTAPPSLTFEKDDELRMEREPSVAPEQDGEPNTAAASLASDNDHEPRAARVPLVASERNDEPDTSAVSAASGQHRGPRSASGPPVISGQEGDHDRHEDEDEEWEIIAG